MCIRFSAPSAPAPMIDSRTAPTVGRIPDQLLEAKLPEKKEDRINGEYYVNDKGKPFRWVDGKLYGPTEPEFTKKIKTEEA